MTLEPYEEEVLVRMYDKELIMMRYTSIQRIRGMIRWDEIAQKYGVKRSLNKVFRHLFNTGYVSDHGKSGDVASLTKIGVEYVLQRTSRQPSRTPFFNR